MKTIKEIINNALDNYFGVADIVKQNGLSGDLKSMIQDVIISQRQEFKELATKDLEVVLDFVERWNKQDKETDVANAANRLSLYLTKSPTLKNY